MTRKQALLRRADKLIAWLSQGRFAVYQDAESIEDLQRLIIIILDIVDNALSEHRKARKHFLGLFSDTRELLEPKAGQEAGEAYAKAADYLKWGLEQYRILIEHIDWDTAK